jgi:protoporphyrin/coproporphyrin ferrochelatase
VSEAAAATGRVGVVLANFGEPAEATLEQIVPFLERIFASNAMLEATTSQERSRERSRELARRRAPGLLKEYQAIGGSPMNRQAGDQAEALEAELGRRGLDARVWLGMQFTEPEIRDVVQHARDEAIDVLVGLPGYPLCGPSTTVAALRQLEQAVAGEGWNVALREVAGWHRHPAYVRLRADGIRRTAEAAGLTLHDGDGRLVFSAHGTPLRYLQEGSRYQAYVEDNCRAVARAAGVEDYVIGYQNHTNRPVEWTQPDVADAIRALDADAVVVPISFMHEQSETLSELDIELRDVARQAGIDFHRVPVPHDDPRFASVLADLVEAALPGRRTARELPWGDCLCHAKPGVCGCTNFGEVG